MKRFVQMLQSGWAPESHWTLKSPIHALYINSLMQQFPDARVVVMHRYNSRESVARAGPRHQPHSHVRAPCMFFFFLFFFFFAGRWRPSCRPSAVSSRSTIASFSTPTACRGSTSAGYVRARMHVPVPGVPKLTLALSRALASNISLPSGWPTRPRCV